MGRRNRNRSAPPQQPPAVPAPDWKSHPIAVAAASAVATSVFFIGLGTQVVIPTQTAKLEIENLKLRETLKSQEGRIEAGLREKSSLSEKAKAAEAQVSARDKKISVLERELADARALNLFQPGNAYPLELDVVRLGAPLSDLKRAYPTEATKFEDERHRAVVTLTGSPFGEAWYYYARKDEKKKIIHIVFWLDQKKGYSGEFLEERLVAALGKPLEQPRPNHQHWRVGRDVSVYKMDRESYSIMQSRFEPALWPGENDP